MQKRKTSSSEEDEVEVHPVLLVDDCESAAVTQQQERKVGRQEIAIMFRFSASLSGLRSGPPRRV